MVGFRSSAPIGDSFLPSHPIYNFCQIGFKTLKGSFHFLFVLHFSQKQHFDDEFLNTLF